ncbi:uncharacterized protein [Nicotiana sylvestris]|uniref:uncharacterized protein n=1 Tax=Nicotiana sylvestris TaxID=4096 RepID=UPI00388CC8BB
MPEPVVLKAKAPTPRPHPPYPQRLSKKNGENQFKKFIDMMKSLSLNVPLVEALEQMPSYAKFMKDLVTKKRSMNCETIKMKHQVSHIVHSMAPKLEDPRAFTIPCTIGSVDFAKALRDLGVSINFMPYLVFKILGIGQPRPTMRLQMVDRTMKRTLGIIDDVLVSVDKFILPDFVIVDCEVDYEVPIILGRPFLATGKALVDVEAGRVHIVGSIKEEKSNWMDLGGYPQHKLHLLLAESAFYCFLSGYSGYNQILIAPEDLEKTTFTCPSMIGAYLLRSCVTLVMWRLELFLDINKIFHPVYYASKTINDAQVNYTVTEKELLAIVFAMEKFHPYLMGTKVIVHTDHVVLWYLMSKKYSKARLMRWVILLQEFDLETQDRKGSENQVADHLSRLEEEGRPHDGLEINDSFPDEQLLAISMTRMPWFANLVNYLVSGIVPNEFSAN